MVCFSLPVSWGMTRTLTAMKGMNNLSPLEEFWLRSRLERIKSGIQNDFSSHILSNLVTLEAKTTNARTPTFIFPGAGGVDELVLELKESNPNSKIIDWKEYRGSILTASFDSEAVGEAIAELVLDKIVNKFNDEEAKKNEFRRNLPTSSSGIRFIGISVGAFAANAAATIIYRNLTGNNSKSKDDNDRCDPFDIHLVLLDPFCGRGAFGPNYGRYNFGKYATTALQILNTDDPVPTTNDSLPFCYCIDVTDAAPKRDFVPLPGDSMHSWPLAYFIRHYKDDDAMDPQYVASKMLPRGKVKKL